ncbi:MAG: hypothetical protein NT154_07185 [Verrucomicrobia bacterium]|nr:hypothetical protein [Verrucomicrobiota bacterium]
MIKPRIEYPGAMCRALRWIVERLHVGSWTYVSSLVNAPHQTNAQAQPMLLLCQQ